LVPYFYIDICVESRYGHISHICSLQALPFPPYSWGYTSYDAYQPHMPSTASNARKLPLENEFFNHHPKCSAMVNVPLSQQNSIE